MTGGPRQGSEPGSERRTPDAIFGQISAASAVKIAVAIVGPLVCALGILGGIGSFATVRHLATPWFGGQAWIVPVGVDVGILALLAWDLLAEYLGMSWPLLRWAAWAFIAATVYLNIAAAHGSVTASVMHAAMPALFVTVVEGIRHLIRQCTGMVTGTRIERIPVSRWLLAPRTSFLLGRSMVLWHVTSYRDGLQLEYQRSIQVARLQQQYGRWLWRWRAPLQDRLALRLTPADAILSLSGSSAAAPEQPADIPERPDGLLAQLPRHCLVEPPKPAATPLSDGDKRLIKAATAILREASGQGTAISQAALARKLRASGHSIGNDRLGWLTVTVRNRLPGEQPDLSGGAMTGEDEPIEADQILGLAPIFTPTRAAEILRGLGLDEMTECALRTRAYRKQIPFHLNGHRLTFTLADLREIAEGRAYRPEPARGSEKTEPKPIKAVPPRGRAPAPSRVPPQEVWRARRPRDA